MTIALVRKPPKEALAQLERVVIEGDLATLSENERIGYYARVCESLGLNPLTRPFEYIRLNGKLTLYARKDATDQLRKINKVSVERLERERDADLDLAIVTAYGRDGDGRVDSSMGAVSIKGLSGEALANALMKAETKAKRRLTLSLAGLGWLDESEAEAAVEATVEDMRADPEHEGLRERMAQRTAALRGESTGEPEAVQHDGGATSEGDDHAARDTRAAREPSDGSPKGDPWMRRLHAVAAERGMDHDALHDWAVEHFRVESLSDLTTPQRATFMELVERMDVMPQPEREPVGARAAEPAPVDVLEPSPSSPEAAAPAPTIDDVLDATGGELIEQTPPRPGTDQYRALSAPEKATARAYWAQREAEAKERPDADQLKAALQ